MIVALYGMSMATGIDDFYLASSFDSKKKKKMGDCERNEEGYGRKSIWIRTWIWKSIALEIKSSPAIVSRDSP
ncbi:Uncharacterized protein HZ326_14451, partial [Fusarium oxysporum f. sp. albedinis]